MGESRRRGTFEQRKALAIQREQDRLDAIEADRLLRYRQECEAYNVMVWWQIDMSEARHSRIIRAKRKSQMAWVRLMGMLHGWDSFSSINRLFR
jgi:hypothetical protein